MIRLMRFKLDHGGEGCGEAVTIEMSGFGWESVEKVG